MAASPSEPRLTGESLWRVEAARYALLRRLAYAMRHHLVVNLQPIGMITEVMDRRLQAASPDLAQVQDSMGRINTLSKAAVQSCLDVVSWLTPEPGAGVTLQAGVDECLSLMGSNLSFRGFSLTEDIAEGHRQVPRAALRAVLPAALLTLTDRARAPARVAIKARSGDEGASVSVAIEPDEGTSGFAGDTPYRILVWDEVQALAAAEGVRIEREGERLRLHFPVFVAA
jgi:hypothetical protein